MKNLQTVMELCDQSCNLIIFALTLYQVCADIRNFNNIKKFSISLESPHFPNPFCKMSQMQNLSREMSMLKPRTGHENVMGEKIAKSVSLANYPLLPSYRDVIRPDVLEEAVLSATLKHLSLMDTVQHIASHEEGRTPEYLLLKDVMGEVYRRLYAIIRQLQVRIQNSL